MADCDNIAVDLVPVDFDVTICSTPAFDVEIIQPDVTLEAISIAGQGPKGDKGDQGDQGVPGTPGAAGAPGSPGTAASVNAGTTTTGAPGTNASVENSGTTSVAIFDFTIPRGDKGDKGDIGQGILIKGSVPNHASLPTTGNTPGDVWIASDTSHGWAWNGTAWVDIGPIQGPPGAVGPSGPAGSDGAPGAAGSAATVAAGPTVTSAPGTNAAVINTGTSSAAVFAFTIPRGDVGQQGPAGAPGSIGIDGAPGAPGAAGGNAWTLVTNASFTVPAYGANVTVQAGDTSWVALGEWVYVDDASGPGVAGQLVVTAKTPSTLTLFNPTPTTYPLASTSTDGLLRKVSGLTSDYIDGTNNSQAIAPQIWSVRLRSFNAIGNPNFEVDQRNVGQFVAIPGGNNFNFACDRWSHAKIAATMAYNVRASAFNSQPTSIPGTSFCVTQSQLVISLTTQQATLAATEVAAITQNVEGPMMRELISDVHSVSILAITNVVGGLKFALTLRHPTGNPSLCKLCTLTSANVLQLITLPNLPVFPSGGNFNLLSGNAGYVLGICFAAGANNIPVANDTWQSSNYLGAIGMDNLGAKPVGSYLAILFVQHEPGPICTLPMDKPFAGANGNLDECLRYYCKSYEYATKPGTNTFNGATAGFIANSTTSAVGFVTFPKRMAKIPGTGIYNPNGAPGQSYDMNSGVAATINSVDLVGDTGFLRLNSTGGGFTATRSQAFQWTADTGW